MAVDYFLLVFFAAVGVLQLVAAANGLRGLLFLPRGVAAVVGPLLAVGTIAWFFGSKPRNLPDTAGGLNGVQQAAIFAVAATLAILVTLLIPSVLRRSSGSPALKESGLDALRQATYGQALLNLLARWRRR